MIDTSTFFDIRRAPKHARALWAQNTIYHLMRYLDRHPKLTICAFTVFEHLDGLYRQGQSAQAGDFLKTVLPSLQVVYPDTAVYALAAQINAALSLKRHAIGVVDTFIAATAIHHKLIVVSANTRHFQRVVDAGFPCMLENWRDV